MQSIRRDCRHPSTVARLARRSDGKQVITGYAAVFYDPADPGTRFMLMDDVEERILPGAFDRAIREDDVRALFNHSNNHVLGRTAAKTLRLSTDARGLKYEIDPPDTQTARDLLASLSRGDISGSSFQFEVRRSADRRENGVYVHELIDLKLFDVGPVTFPAYTGTAAGVRAGGDLAAAARDVDLIEITLLELATL